MPVTSLLKPEVKQVLDELYRHELYASHLYRHVANQLQRLGYFGGQKFFAGESADELEHAHRHEDFQNDRGSVATVPALPAVTAKIGTLYDAISLGYKTERELCDKYASAYVMTASDPMAQQFLLQFLEIQRKSTGEYGDLLARLDRANGDECGILIVDQELGAK